MRVTAHTTLGTTGETDSARYWDIYRRAFDDLRAVAVQRHLMNRPEFDTLLADDRVIKYVVEDETTGRLAALATMTSDLHAVPLISPEYFAARWPERYARQEIWYVPFVGVDPDYQGTGAMGQIIGMMCEVPITVGGAICVDICEHVEDTIRLPSAIERIAASFSPGVKRARLDTQVFWGYEFPTPA